MKWKDKNNRGILSILQEHPRLIIYVISITVTLSLAVGWIVYLETSRQPELLKNQIIGLEKKHEESGKYYRDRISELHKEYKHKITELKKRELALSQIQANNQLQINSLQKKLWELKKNHIQLKLSHNRIIESEYDFFIIYGQYSQPPYYDFDSIIKIPKKFSLHQKLKILADSLSILKFKNLPITVVKIDTLKDKSVLVVNLSEAENAFISEYGKSWKSFYFQGSTGGAGTTMSLRETFLQRNYPNNWIDGVKFTYKGKDILTNQWDHISGLSGISYR